MTCLRQVAYPRAREDLLQNVGTISSICRYAALRSPVDRVMVHYLWSSIIILSSACHHWIHRCTSLKSSNNPLVRTYNSVKITGMTHFVSASVTKILGEYNHSFSIRDGENFAILYGPNGVGKTKFLQIINAISHLSAFELLHIPFKSAYLRYSDNSSMTVTRNNEKDNQDALWGEDDEASRSPLLTFRLSLANEKTIGWKYRGFEFEQFIRSRLGYERISDRMWRDPRDGEIVDIDELTMRFSDLRRRRKSAIRELPPQEMKEFLDKVPSFLIDTQRLRTEETEDEFTAQRTRYSRRMQHSVARISKEAEDIKNLLKNAQTEHSRITQQLDRTFPSRVLTPTEEKNAYDPEDIRKRYNDQNVFRNRLAKVVSVPIEEELSLHDEQLKNNWALTLLNQYLDDAEKKLKPFESPLEKIDLLEDIINQRLLNKTLTVSDRNGISIQHSKTKKDIPLDALSSGEQHEIILMTDLLFNVPEGALVLIDEPEISLHILWQLAFIPDVERIATNNGFRFVVATHSPQIINDQWDSAVQLGPQDGVFE